jgi:hypothetical protein
MDSFGFTRDPFMQICHPSVTMYIYLVGLGKSAIIGMEAEKCLDC